MPDQFYLPTGSELRELSRQRIAQLEATVEGLRERAEQAEARASRAEAERDAIAAAWPEAGPNGVWKADSSLGWCRAAGLGKVWPGYATKLAAVRAAAGLDAGRGSTNA